MWPPLFLKPYLGRIVCTLLGLAAGILMLAIGFWKTLLLAALTALGYCVGCWKDGKPLFGRIDLSRFRQRRLR